MSQAEKQYQELFTLSHHISTLDSILSLLHWDQETYMPHGGADFRSKQVQLMSGMIHEEVTSKKYANTLGKLVDLETGKLKCNGLPHPQQAALREWYRDWKISSAMPAKFVKEFSSLTSQALSVWRTAKENDDFETFAPYLQKIVDMSRKKADYLGWKEHPYDALVDLYERSITTKEVDELFSRLKKPIRTLLDKIESKRQVDDSFLHGRFSESKQIEFSRQLLNDMGYDFNVGRIDLSTHPFSTDISPQDNRITTRIHPSWIVSNILVILHEGGHSLYSMGLPKEHFGSPLGQAISMGMHECQSRFWETRIGQSKPFWKHYFPLLKEQFKNKFEGVTLNAFYKAVNKVYPSFIRVDADEVTYPMHIILRFEMERDLIDGTIAVKDVPEVWNDKMDKLLGIRPKNNREGCLQDIHWAMGGFGYFPSYALGTIYASQLFNAMAKDYPDWEKRLAKGDLIFVKKWLNEAVHRHGRRYNSLELLKKITGKKVTSDAFTSYLNEKYSGIYNL